MILSERLHNIENELELWYLPRKKTGSMTINVEPLATAKDVVNGFGSFLELVKLRHDVAKPYMISSGQLHYIGNKLDLWYLQRSCITMSQSCTWYRQSDCITFETDLNFVYKKTKSSRARDDHDSPDGHEKRNPARLKMITIAVMVMKNDIQQHG